MISNLINDTFTLSLENPPHTRTPHEVGRANIKMIYHIHIIDTCRQKERKVCFDAFRVLFLIFEQYMVDGMTYNHALYNGMLSQSSSGSVKVDMEV